MIYKGSIKDGIHSWEYCYKNELIQFWVNRERPNHLFSKIADNVILKGLKDDKFFTIEGEIERQCMMFETLIDSRNQT